MTRNFLLPLSLAFLGLATAILLNTFVWSSPRFPQSFEQFLSLPSLNPPKLLELFRPLENRQSRFGRLIAQPTKVPSNQTLNQAVSKPTSANGNNETPDPDLTSGNKDSRMITPPTTDSINLPSADAVEISDADLNRTIESFIPPNVPVKDVEVSFHEGKILVSGKLVSPIEGDFTAEATISLVNGIPVVKITKANLGPLPIPTFLLSSLETAANEAIRNALNSQNLFKVKVLEVKEGKIRFSATLN